MYHFILFIYLYHFVIFFSCEVFEIAVALKTFIYCSSFFHAEVFSFEFFCKYYLPYSLDHRDFFSIVFLEMSWPKKVVNQNMVQLNRGLIFLRKAKGWSALFLLLFFLFALYFHFHELKKFLNPLEYHQLLKKDIYLFYSVSSSAKKSLSFSCAVKMHF